jgi:hypothetical protein
MNFKNNFIQFIFYFYEIYLNFYLYLINIFNLNNKDQYYINYFYLYDTNLTGMYYKLNIDKLDMNYIKYNQSCNQIYNHVNLPKFNVKNIPSNNNFNKELEYYDATDKFEFKLECIGKINKYNIIHYIDNNEYKYELILKDMYTNNRYSHTEYYKPYMLKLPPIYNVFKLHILFKYGLQKYINLCIPTFYRIVDIDRYNIKGIYMYVYVINGLSIKKQVFYKPNRRFLL